MVCEWEKSQVDEVGVYSHRQQQDRQLEQRVQTQEHGTGHHGNNAAQDKDLKKEGNKEEVKILFRRYDIYIKKEQNML